MVERIGFIGRQLPVPILGIDSDNDSAFINESLVTYCAGAEIEYSRSRAYRKNDQAWIEQKNGAVIRRWAGHERYSGPVAGSRGLARYSQEYHPISVLVDRGPSSL